MGEQATNREMYSISRETVQAIKREFEKMEFTSNYNLPEWNMKVSSAASRMKKRIHS